MRNLEQIQFKRAGVNRNGDAVYDLWIDGVPAECGLTIDEVVQRITEADPLDRSPETFRTPEDRRPAWTRRSCPEKS